MNLATAAAAAGESVAQLSFAKYLSKMVAEQGPLSLYSGLGAGIARYPPVL
jgi:hypothetical protein